MKGASPSDLWSIKYVTLVSVKSPKSIARPSPCFVPSSAFTHTDTEACAHTFSIKMASTWNLVLVVCAKESESQGLEGQRESVCKKSICKLTPSAIVSDPRALPIDNLAMHLCAFSMRHVLHELALIAGAR